MRRLSHSTIIAFFRGQAATANAVKLLREIGVVSLAEYSTLAALVAVNFLINHFYGAGAVGTYAVAYAIGQIGIMGLGSAFSLLLRRDLSLSTVNINSYVHRIIMLRIATLGIVAGLAAVVIGGFYEPLRLVLPGILIIVLAKGIDALAETYYTANQAVGRLAHYGILKCFHAALFLLVSLGVCLSGSDIGWLYGAQLAASVFSFLAATIVWRASPFAPSVSSAIVSYRYLFIESYPLIVSAIVFQTGVRANTLVIFDRLGSVEVGIFSLIHLAVSTVAGVGNTLALVFFPRLSRTYADARGQFMSQLHRTAALFMAVGLTLTAIFFVLAPLVPSVIGTALDSTIYPLMASALPFLFIVSCLGTIFTVIHRQRVGMYLAAVVLVVNLLIYYGLTDALGLMGAAYAYLISAIFQSILMYLGLRFSFKPVTV